MPAYWVGYALEGVIPILAPSKDEARLKIKTMSPQEVLGGAGADSLANRVLGTLKTP